MTLYDADGRKAYCGNCIWGQLQSPFKKQDSPYGVRYIGGQVHCQLNPKRGDFGFPIMEFYDHCSHHPALVSSPVLGVAKSDLPITISQPVSDWLQVECPTCGAEPDEICDKGFRGRRRNGVHSSREGAAWIANLPGCPFCDAQPGLPCVGPQGERLLVIHYAREMCASGQNRTVT